MLVIEALRLVGQRFVEFIHVECLQRAVSLRHHAARLISECDTVVGLQLLVACCLVLLVDFVAGFHHTIVYSEVRNLVSTVNDYTASLLIKL